MKPQHSGCESERITRRAVSFSHPFSLGRTGDVLPAGDYEVETVEQSLEAVQGAVYVRKSTTLIIPTASGFRCRDISPAQLEDALVRDAGLHLREPSENPDAEKADGHE
jgi:hypothetical protein